MFVRLLEISKKENGSRFSLQIDYYPSQSNMEVSIRSAVSSSNSKNVFHIPYESASIATLILSWKYPNLAVTINCAQIIQYKFTSMDEVQALAMPYLEPNLIHSPGYYTKSIEQTYLEAGCFTTSKTTPMSTVDSSKMSTMVTGLKQPMIKMLAKIDNLKNDERSSTSIPNIPDENSIDFNTFDTNFILTVYNTRILQYQNLVKLQKILKEYNLIDIMTYNLTLFDCL